jgi:DNA-directed RNA polymerase specialized sigma24 family protein
MRKPRGTASLSYKAAVLYKQGGGLTIRDCAERFGISAASVHQALLRIRLASLNSWPEDECTC